MYKSNILPYLSFFLVWGIFLFTTGCNRDDVGKRKNEVIDPLAPKPAVRTSVSGIVIDENGQPLAGANVNMHGESATTGNDGMFYFEDADVPGNRCVVSATLEGYFTGTRAFEPIAQGFTDTRIVLMERATTHTFQAASGVEASLADGSAVKIEAASLMLPSGEPYEGNVNMSVRYLDPTAGNFGVLVPGGDMIARREDESTSILYSYGILRVEMWDDADTRLQVMPGKSATLIMNIPEAQRGTAPATIPLWWFDEEAGHWQEEGFATREGNAYVGTVTHFTDWNCDVPENTATIIGRLIDCNGEPGWGVIEFGQITSDPQASAESGQHDGRFSRRVPANVQTTVVLSDPLTITPLTKDGRGKVIIIVPPLAPGTVYDVGDVQVFPCPVDVIATFETNYEDYVYSLVFSTEEGSRGLMHPGASLNADLPPNKSIKMEIETARGITYESTFQTGGEGSSLDLGIIDLTRSFIGSKAIIKGVTLCHGVPEAGGQVAVTWQTETGTNFEYALPQEDGSFLVNAPLGTGIKIVSVTPAGTWEQELTTSAEPGFVHDLGDIELCDNPVVGDTEFTLTGDGLQNEVFRFRSNENWRGTNHAIWYTQDGMTFVSIYSAQQDMVLTLLIPGQGIGQYNSSTQTMMVSIQRQVSSGARYYRAGLIHGGQVSVSVTKYEAVGGAVEGTFSGTFVVNEDVEAEPVIVTNGKFSALRYPDDSR